MSQSLYIGLCFPHCFSWSWLGSRRSHVSASWTPLTDIRVVTIYTCNDAYCLEVSQPCFLANYTPIADSAVVGTNSNFSGFKFQFWSPCPVRRRNGRTVQKHTSFRPGQGGTGWPENYLHKIHFSHNSQEYHVKWQKWLRNNCKLSIFKAKKI